MTLTIRDARSVIDDHDGTFDVLTFDDLATLTRVLGIGAQDALEAAAGADNLAARLRSGEHIGGWASGEDGARAADGLASSFRHTAQRYEALADRLDMTVEALLLTDEEDPS